MESTRHPSNWFCIPIDSCSRVAREKLKVQAGASVGVGDGQRHLLGGINRREEVKIRVVIAIDRADAQCFHRTTVGELNQIAPAADQWRPGVCLPITRSRDGKCPGFGNGLIGRGWALVTTDKLALSLAAPMPSAPRR